MLEQRTIVYQKVCGCKEATASGPRLVQMQHTDTSMRGRADGNSRHAFEFKAVVLACDVCDAPWEKIERDDLAFRAGRLLQQVRNMHTPSTSMGSIWRDEVDVVTAEILDGVKEGGS